MFKTVLSIAVATAVISPALCETVYVSSSSCGQTYVITDAGIKLKYNGLNFGDECTMTFTSDEILPDICVTPKDFDLKSCNLVIEYHNGFTSSFPDKTYSCRSKQYSDHCTVSTKLYIVFKKSGSSPFMGSDDIELKIFKKSEDNIIVEAVKTTVYLIVGVVVAVIVIIIVVIIIIVCCCCRRRRMPGTVYRSPQQATAVTTAGAYPMSSQPGYQPPPAGYQYPQPGYQPPVSGQQPPPAGYQAGYVAYQQSPAGYPPASQQGYAGYQTGADLSMSEKPTSMPSAPPMPLAHEPPPYPGK